MVEKPATPMCVWIGDEINSGIHRPDGVQANADDSAPERRSDTGGVNRQSTSIAAG